MVTNRKGEIAMNRKKLFTAAISIALCAAMSIPANAAVNPYAALEAKSRQAVEVAIKAGSIPPDKTIYDCKFVTGEDKSITVIQYKDKNGDWIDAATGKKAADQSATTAGAVKTPTAEELQAYADKILELVNLERGKAGVPPLERSSYLDDAAMIRAEECASLNDIRINGQAHIRPDGSRWFIVFGITKNYNYGENAGQGKTRRRNK